MNNILNWISSKLNSRIQQTSSLWISNWIRLRCLPRELFSRLTFPLNQITVDCRRRTLVISAKCLKLVFSVFSIRFGAEAFDPLKHFFVCTKKHAWNPLNHVRTNLFPATNQTQIFSAFSVSIAYSWGGSNRCICWTTGPLSSDWNENEVYERVVLYIPTRECVWIATEHERARRLEWACQLNNKTLFN